MEQQPELKIATGINTAIFFSIIEDLKKDKFWKLSAEYAEWCFDKGIDFDLYQFIGAKGTIMFAWTNWFEGEIKACDELLSELSAKYTFKLEFGEPEYLHKPGILEELKKLLRFRN